MAPSGISTHRIVDLRSDTVSLPTADMRQAMFEAELGDDVYGEDPTIIALEKKSARLLGKEAALFVPSGTMGNLIALMVHCQRRGSEAIVGNLSHVFLYEQGGAAHIANVLLNPIANAEDGTFCLTAFQEKFRGIDIHEPRTNLAIVENTHNMQGGKVIPLDWLDEFCRICKQNDIATHMDGARLFNAATYLKVPVDRVVRDFDSVQFCLSKGLCAPVGSILVGTIDFIDEARRMRKALGGGMRQSGVLAAAGIVALDTIVPKLADDHRSLRRIAQAVHDLQSSWATVDIDNVHTNICIVKMSDSNRVPSDLLVNRLLTVTDEELKDGITDSEGNGIVLKISSRNRHYARLVVHQGVTTDLIDLAIKKIVYCIPKISI